MANLTGFSQHLALYAEIDAAIADIPTRDDRPIDAVAADLRSHADTLDLASEYAREMFLVLEIHKLREGIESGQRRLLALCNEFYNLPAVKIGLDELRRKHNPQSIVPTVPASFDDID